MGTSFHTPPLCPRATEAVPDRGLIVVKNPKSDEREPPKNFTFDHVFDENVAQKFIYDSCMCQVVQACLEGFNGTIFACKFIIVSIRTVSYPSYLLTCPLLFQSLSRK